jgi:uncharacterized membrane protein
MAYYYTDKCIVCGNIGKYDAETLKGNVVRVCKRCKVDIETNELSKGDLHVAHFAKLNKT